MITLPTSTVQKALTHLGYGPGVIDGRYGTNTDAAIARWANDFRTGYGFFPRTMSSPDGRSVEVDPNEAASLLQTAARQYDRAHVASEPIVEATRTVTRGAVLVVLLGVGGAALWASGFLGGRFARRRAERFSSRPTLPRNRRRR